MPPQLMLWTDLFIFPFYFFFLTQPPSWTNGESFLVAQQKRICLQCRSSRRRQGFDPWVGKIPWRRKWQPTPVFLPGESHGWRNLAGYSPWGRKEADTTEATQHACTHKWRSLGFLETFHQQGSGSQRCPREPGRWAGPQRVRLVAELRLCVQKSSLILCNCLDLFIGKGQVPKVVSKSLADGPWPWLGGPHPACFTTRAPLRQREQRIPATFLRVSEPRAPVTEGKAWGLRGARLGSVSFLSHISTICEIDKAVLPAQAWGNWSDVVPRGHVAMSADTCGCHKLAGRGVGAALLGSGGRDQGCSKHSTMHRTAPFSPSEELPTAGLPCGSSG